MTGSLIVFSALTHNLPPFQCRRVLPNFMPPSLLEAFVPWWLSCSASWKAPQLSQAFYNVRLELNVLGPRVKREFCYVPGVLPVILRALGFSSVSWAS